TWSSSAAWPAPRQPGSKMRRKDQLRFLLCVMWLLLTIALTAAQSNQAGPQAVPSPLAEAQALLTAGKADAAIAALRGMPKSEATDAQVNHLLGLAYYQKGDYPHAIEYLYASAKQAQGGTPQYR